MKKFLASSFAVLFVSSFTFAQQKGIDTQTQKIKEETNRTNGTQRGNDAGGRSINWDGKSKIREQLANPYRLNARRDVLVETISDALKERKIIIDDAASRPKDGVIITQPFVFARGAVTARNELSRYGVLPNSDTSWTRGRYTLTIEVQSIDGVQNNVSVTAKVEGRSENGLRSEWTTVQSTGAAEDEFLVKLIELATGASPDDKPDNVDKP